MASKSPNVHRTPGLLHADLRFRWTSGSTAAGDDELLAKCSELFGRSYGRWGSSDPRAGQPIRLPVSRIRDLLAVPDSWLASAWLPSGELIGYCVVTRPVISGAGVVNWVTQLVVREDVRKMRVATRLMYSAWQFSDCWAWGLVTANPYAVRALETATRRACNRKMITTRGDSIASALAAAGTYVPSMLLRRLGKITPIVNTDFRIDHRDVRRMRRDSARAERRWALSDIDEGQEWFACTFRDQAPRDIGQDRLEHLLQAGDRVWIEAYERMTLDQQHTWHSHEEAELDFIADAIGLAAGDTVLDVGCGDGRHVAVMAARGYDVDGIDIAPRLIQRAKTKYPPLANRFVTTDARAMHTSKKYDAVLCLYDVVGSTADRGDDLALLKRARSSLEPGGSLVLSVMNAEPTLSLLDTDRRAGDEAELVVKLEKLQPSTNMEDTGNIFDPTKLLLFRDVFYRKEQFVHEGDQLPTEIVIRDRRFTSQSLTAVLTEAGFVVERVIPVQAGRWNRTPVLQSSDTRAKELVAFARRV